MRDQPGPDDPEGQAPGDMSPIGWKSRYTRPLEDPRYRMRRLDLRFHDSQVEAKFLIDYRRSTLGFRRVGVAIGLASFAVFAPIDIFNSPNAWRALWAVRFGLVVPVLAILFLASFWRKAKSYFGVLVNLGLVISSLALVGMIHLSTRAVLPQHFESLILLLPSAFGFLRLRVMGATATSILAVAGFVVETVWLRPLPEIQLTYMLGFLLAACVVGVGLAYLMERQTRLSFVLTTSLDEASVRDPLTGLHNRRWLEVTLEQLTSAFQRYGAPFSLILIDLDGFKAVNDRFGYTQGDGLLRRFSEALTVQLRKADIIFRYGGDEFIILAPATAGPAAVSFVARLRSHIRTLDLSEFGLSLPLEFSAGVAEVNKADGDAVELFQRANRALRAAKDGGGKMTALDEA